MKYTKEERLDIGHRIYDGGFTIYTAAELFGVSAMVTPLFCVQG